MKPIFKLILIFFILIPPIALAILLYKKEAYVEITRRSNIKKAFCQEFQPEYHNGEVSYYDRTYCEKYNPSCITASGEVFDDTAFTCACDYEYPLGTMFRFYYKDKSVVVKCNDRGSFKKYGRVADLSKASFKELASIKKGVLEVKYEILDPYGEAFKMYREYYGLSELVESEELDLTAYLSARAIFNGERSWSHEGYQASISAHYKDWFGVGENLARNHYKFENVLTSWHNSEGHKKNLQAEIFCEFGIGNFGDIWVLHLGRLNE